MPRGQRESPRDKSISTVDNNMWLINVHDLKLENFVPPHLPPYAILSHTWEDDEVTFQDFANLRVARRRRGFAKIQKTCDLAAAAEINYAWVDTCCIDKSSSAELSEAINSMFEWYRQSSVCFAFLSDLHGSSNLSGNPNTLWLDEERRHKCRWFHRGWTLQELLAPHKLEFYDAEWKSRGLKTDPLVMRQLSSITGIRGRSTRVLRNSETICDVAISERMSWASGRETTRIEDAAYCLLGIFQVNMPMLYGEGHRAFQRLQEEIIKNSTDMSLFCWQATDSEQSYRGLLARSPAEFASYYHIDLKSRTGLSWAAGGQEKEYAVTNKGIRIDAELLSAELGGKRRKLLRCTLFPDNNVVNIVIRHYRDNIYVRELPATITPSDSTEIERKVIYVAKDVDKRMSEKLRGSLDPMLRLKVSPLPADLSLVPKMGWPAEQWQAETHRFHLTTSTICKCLVVYELFKKGEKINEFVVLCQRNASASQPLRYALVPLQDVAAIVSQMGVVEEKGAPVGVAAEMERHIVSGKQTMEFEMDTRVCRLFISRFAPYPEAETVDTLYITLVAGDEPLRMEPSDDADLKLLERAERLQMEEPEPEMSDSSHRVDSSLHSRERRPDGRVKSSEHFAKAFQSMDEASSLSVLSPG